MHHRQLMQQCGVGEYGMQCELMMYHESDVIIFSNIFAFLLLLLQG